MRTARIKQSGTNSARNFPVWRAYAVLLAVAALSFAPPSALSAPPDQAVASKTPTTTQKTTQRARKQTNTPKPSPAVAAVPEQEIPKPPAWPANDQPAAANVVWNSQGLRIDAANSSLQQILKDVSTATGVTVSGLGSDLRIFGNFGPGPARDVLSQLLVGSGYNVLMIGDQGQGTPRQLMLSKRPSGSTAPRMANNSNQSSDDGGSADVEEPPPPQPEPQQPQQTQQTGPQQPPNVPPGFTPGAQPRTPQQILQEMQQRQQQIEQMQQQQRTNPQ